MLTQEQQYNDFVLEGIIVMETQPVVHFGITMRLRTRGYKLTRENYAVVSNKSSFGKSAMYADARKKNDEKLLKKCAEIYADEDGLIYTDETCEKKLIRVMQNFDLNMNFYKNLDHRKFEKEITRFLKKTKFIEITDLNDYSCSGYYVLVLDEYCQVYVGTASDIKNRIRQHWGGGKMKFDRLLCGQVHNSRLSIDSFRALDTTRILVYPCDNVYSYENKFIELFSDEFICNRVSGGSLEDNLSFAVKIRMLV